MGVLGAFDPTLLQNGSYNMVVNRRGRTAGNVTTVQARGTRSKANRPKNSGNYNLVVYGPDAPGAGISDHHFVRPLRPTLKAKPERRLRVTAGRSNYRGAET